ncbi:hypothetical protein RCH09_003022 [Actimicrobium sp. GrIS 1.19]|uniref:DUF3306 domain-containing protein n=1 Tax=Actimicrobium sp. GrIS 1.19 TaxID=3071708 RepID=UPI002DFF03FB|nr:hypothetical protein [Actimicrobium sp. GrIS 1.19]
MAADEFFARWARKPPTAEPIAAEVEPAEALPPPTLDDAAALTLASDFKPFLAHGVDESVKRLALKKLFSDPLFNVMDGLDTYIEDFNSFVPMTAEMVAALNHGKLLLNPLAHLEAPLMELLQMPPVDTAPDQPVETAPPETQTEEPVPLTAPDSPAIDIEDRQPHLDDPIQSL